MERVPTPDPVSQSAEYQDYLVGLIGEQDPADVQAAGPDAWPARASPNAPNPTSGRSWSAWATRRTPSWWPPPGTAGSSRTTSPR
jgi:hypothetical protein